MTDEDNDENTIEIDDILIPLKKTNEEITDELFKGLDFSKISSVGSRYGKPKTPKNRERMIDKEAKMKRNIFHNKVMRRY